MRQRLVRRRLFPGIYWHGPGDPESLDLLIAAAARLPDVAVFSGRTAAWLHGFAFDPCDPVEATVPDGIGVAARSGMRIRRAGLDPDEVVVRQFAACTSVPRTLADLAVNRVLEDVVALVDEALHRELTDLRALEDWVGRNPGRHGVKRLRVALRYAEPLSESHQETRLRMRLVLAKLPRPVAQHEIRTANGDFVARVDLAYPEFRIVIEYDGEVHRDRISADDRRQNRIVAAGWDVLRFAEGDLPTAAPIVKAAIARIRRRNRAS